jgi:DNA-binding LacI/PurR family transcriptional regulator
MSHDAKPLYYRIYQDLKEKIETGEYKPDDQLPTEIELAEMHGVSRITSKRALIELEREGLIYRKRGSGSFVKRPEQRQFPEVTRSQIISMILPYVAANGLLGYIQGATDYLDSKGYYLTIHSSNWSEQKEREFLQQLPQRGASGIILYPVSTQTNQEDVFSLYLKQYPIVTIDQYYDNIPIGSVTSDNFKGGYLAASNLIALGHRRIAFVSSIPLLYRSSLRDRFFGYAKALQEAGIPIDDEIIVHDPLDRLKPGERARYVQDMVDRLVEKGTSAIQAEHDHLAVELVRAAAELNIKVPDDLSIVGFDNHEISANIEIPVTTVNQDCYEIGKQAAALIMSQIEQGLAAEPKKTVVDVKWIARQSTGRAL